MKLGHLFQTLEIALRSRWRLVVLAFITLLFCIFVLPKTARPAVTPESLPGLSLEQWRSQSPISRSPQDSPSPEELLQKAHELQIEGYYRNSCKLLLKALDVNLSDAQFERLIRDEYPEADVEQEVQKLFPVEPETPFRATTLRRLGDVLRTIGSIRPSEIVLNQSFKIAERFADAEETSAIHFSLGNTYRALGKREQIIQETEAQKKEQKEINDRQALEHYDRAIAQSSNASLKLRAKLSKLSLLIEIKPDRDVILLANDVKSTLESLDPNLETVYARLDLAQSLTCLNVKHTRTDFEYPQPPLVNLCASDSTEERPAIEEEDMPKWDEIEQLLVTAEQQAEQLGDGRSQSYALGNLGEIYEVLGQFSDAKSVTRKATQQIDRYRQFDDILYRWQWQLGRLRLKTSEDTQGAIDAYTAAFYSLQSARRDLTSLNSDLQFNFRDEVEPVYRQFVEVLLDQKARDGKPSQKNLEKTREVIEALQLAEIEDFLKEACANVEDRKIDSIVDNSKFSVAAFYPILLEDSLAIIVKITGEEELIYSQIYGNKQEFKTVLNKLSKEITDDEDIKKQKELFHQVYRWIIEPFITTLSRERVAHLVFVLDSELRNIPMAALYDGNNYLIQQYSISLAPGLQLVQDKLNEANLSKLKFLAAGISQDNPVQGQNYVALFEVERELNEVQQKLKAQLLLNKEFTEEVFESKLKKHEFSAIHIATHGKFSSNSEQTFIVAWGKKIGVEKLGTLLRTINGEKRKNLELLVLSACETAQGDNRATLGISGISIKAGVRSTIASLWLAKDNMAPELFKVFYEIISKNPEIYKAKALQQAQINLIETDRSITPYYWSPYILVGDWR